MQTTLNHSVALTGVGLHTGSPVSLVVKPAMADTGIVFNRTDVPKGMGQVAALWSNVVVSPLNTRLRNEYEVEVSTIEHLMAALAGLGIHNAVVELDGPEVPILDGSSAPFVRALLNAGVQRLSAPLSVIEVLRPIVVANGDAMARLDPASGLEIDFAIDFEDAAIGQQTKTLNMANGSFVRELCDSRTFCRQSDVDAMRAQGLALGGTLDNAVVVDGAQVLSPGGFRHGDEAVRHKMLDALGDLYTAGAPIIGRYTGVRAGHALTNQLLLSLFSDPQNWRKRRCEGAMGHRLPGVGVQKRDLALVA